MNNRQITMAVLHDDAISVLGLEKFLELSMTDDKGRFIKKNPYAQKLFTKVTNFVKEIATEDKWFKLPRAMRRQVIEPVLEACVEYDQEQREGK